MIIKSRTLSTLLIFNVVFILASCTNLQESELRQVHKELKTMRTDISGLSEQVAKLNRKVMPQEPRRMTIDLGRSPVQGERAAKVGMVEFSDFQCPFCRRFHLQVYPDIKKNYIDTGKLMLMFRDLPLDIHPLAKGAAIAANCAANQDNYYNFVNILFKNQKRLGSNLYMEKAKELGLNVKAFELCLSDPAPLSKVEQDLSYGEDLGISGTPTFFIGRIKGNKLVDAIPIVGAQPYSVFSRIINTYLNTIKH